MILCFMPDICLVTSKVTREFLKEVASERYGDMVKVVVDIEKKVMAIGGEMHADEEQFLLTQGSKQQNLWGINLYPEMAESDFIEFDSMINIRPKHGNRSRGVEEVGIREKIIEVVKLFIE